jgi:hypothetical protein
LELYPGLVAFPSAPWSEEPHIRFLSGCDQLDGMRPPLEQLLKDWEQDCEDFQSRKTKYHIYT